MKETSKNTKTTSTVHAKPAAGPEGTSIAPPAYGIENLDLNASQPPAPLQMKTQLSTGGASSKPTSNRTGLPDSLKTGIETLSGLSLDDVQVHTNSSKPAQLNALAYAQGSDIHLAPGQEKHLPHEAWHIVQQKQGRVRPTTTIAEQAVNDNAQLEQEADQMGAQASLPSRQVIQNKIDVKTNQSFTPTIQRETYRISNPSTKGDTAGITEGRWGRVLTGQTINFTALAAGCMAITVVFSDGGGAGLHMALNMPNAAQWNPFRDAVANKKIDTVYLDGDLIGTPQGWYVKSLFDEDYMPRNATEYSPRSANELNTAYGPNFAAASAEGQWAYATGAIQEWFKEVFKAENVVVNTTINGPVSHVCP